MALDPVRKALYDKLVATTGLTGQLSSPTAIYHRRAPVDADPPFVIFHRQSGRSRWTFRTSWRDELWLIKGVCRGRSATDAEEIDAAIEAALNDAVLAVTGYTHLLLRRTNAVDYGEDDGAETFHHCGGLYRLAVQPT